MYLSSNVFKSEVSNGTWYKCNMYRPDATDITAEVVSLEFVLEFIDNTIIYLGGLVENLFFENAETYDYICINLLNLFECNEYHVVGSSYYNEYFETVEELEDFDEYDDYERYELELYPSKVYDIAGIGVGWEFCMSTANGSRCSNIFEFEFLLKSRDLLPAELNEIYSSYDEVKKMLEEQGFTGSPYNAHPRLTGYAHQQSPPKLHNKAFLAKQTI